MIRLIAVAFAAAIGFAYLTISTATAATVTFSDQTFDDADWTLSIQQIDKGGTVSAAQTSAGGNPDAYRRIVNVVDDGPGPGTVRGFHLNVNAIYDPSTQGAIGTLDYYEDSIMFAGFGQGQASGAAFMQDGFLYYTPGPNRLLANQLNAWTSQSLLSLSALDFIGVGTTEAPDFSASGGSITFGFYRANSSPGDGGYTIDAGIDNWSIDIHSVNPVPVPAAAWLFGTALIGFVGYSRRRKVD